MVADRIPNPRHEGSIPSIGAFRYSRIPARTMTTGHSSQFPRDHDRSRGGPAVGQRQGHLIWVEEIGGSSPPSWTRGCLTVPRSRRGTVRHPLGARRMLATGRAGAVHVPCDGNPHHIRRRALERPWFNWKEHLPTKQESAGSSPAGRAVSEAEAVDAPGRGPGGSGFESRRTPEVRSTHARCAIAVPTDTEISDLPAAGRAHWMGGGTR